ncbi:MAG: DNA repair protein RecO C-terminal domain-containing protein, partial [Bacteroidales bacterium]|nr:DNA repair protein RecO C-terminal domain-containing protein [Bacteroidales bacterium]
ALNNDISKICISQFIAEVILKMVKEEEQNLQLYGFFKETVEAIENTNINVANVHLIFLKEFARLLGFEICNNYCAETPYFNTREGMFLPLFTTDYESMDQNVSRDFSQLLTMSYGSNNIKLPYQSRKKIIEMLLEYYKYHTENFSEIKSLRVLNDVFDQS